VSVFACNSDPVPFRLRIVALSLALASVASACSAVSPDELTSRYSPTDLSRLDPAGGVTRLPSPSESATAGEPLDVDDTPCAFDTESVPVLVECGRITVPPRGDPDAAPITIAFAVFRAEARDPEPDPVIYLHGGPGGAVLASADRLYASVIEPFVAERDVILFDQRGAGESSALPICDEAYILDDEFFSSAVPHAELASDYTDLVASCGERLSSDDDIDLSQYNSEAHADDVVDLVRALGIERYNLYGNSYGTRLAQTIMRDHPDGVRSVILSGVYPVEENLIGSVPASFESALDRLFEACVASPICGEALPDPWAAFEEVVARLDADPVPVEIPISQYSNYEGAINGDDLINGFHSLLYTSGAAAMIPDTLIDYLDGDVSRIQRIGRDGLFDIGDVAAYVAVQCREEAPFTTPDQLSQAGASSSAYERINLAPGLIGVDLLEICPSWDTGTPDPVENEPVTWAAPTLLMSGGIDPITPPWWATNLADRLPNATLVVSADLGHDSDEGSCAAGIMTEFIADPARTASIACAASADAPVVDNRPVRLVPELTADTFSGSFDVETGFGSTLVDVQLPDWWGEAYTDEDVWWRNLDQLDPTALVLRAGPVDRDELFWYLDVEAFGELKEAALPSGVGSEWQRFTFSTAGLDLVVYERTDDFSVNITLVGYDDELQALERNILLPVVRSITPREDS